MNKFLLISLLSMPFPAYADEWAHADTIRETVYLTLHFIDYKQTLAIPNLNKTTGHEPYYEQNSILGKYPSADRTALYFCSTAILHMVISQALPAEYRELFQDVTIGVEAEQISVNRMIGIRFKF